MSQFFTIHPDNPNPRLIRQAAEVLREGGVVVYPTDSCYALGCHLDDKDAVARIRQIRKLDEHHHMTLMCRDLSEISRYARVDNVQFRVLEEQHAGQLHLHSGGDQGSAETLAASQAQHDRHAHPRSSGGAGFAGGIGRTAAEHHADPAG